MQDIGAPPLITGNQVQLLVDGPSTYEAMFAAIDKARHYVLVESFIFEEAAAGDRKLSALLAQAAKRGVSVSVLYDAVGSMTTDEAFLAGLEDAGIALCAFNPLNPLDERFSGVNHRDHRKIVVVDGEYAFAGGVNFSQAYHIASKQARRRGLSQQKALHEGWRDTHIAIRGTAARHLEDLFRGTWRDAECTGEIAARGRARRRSRQYPGADRCQQSRRRDQRYLRDAALGTRVRATQRRCDHGLLRSGRHARKGDQGCSASAA